MISVVIPVFNSEDFIYTAIKSTLKQSFQPSEIIVVDDGSTDKSAKIVKNYFPDIKYIYQNNSGSGAARNRGVSLSTSEYIAFLDSDDFWDFNHLYNLYNTIISSHNACLAYCGKKWVNQQSYLIKGFHQSRFPSGWIFNDLLYANYISSTSTVLLKKSIFHAVGGFSESNDLRYSEDYHLWLRISAVCEIASSFNKTVNYRWHDNNLSHNSSIAYRGVLHSLDLAERMIKQNNVDQRNNPDIHIVQTAKKQTYQSACLSLFHQGHYLEFRQFCKQAIKKRYASSFLIIRYLCSYLPTLVIKLFRYSKLKLKLLTNERKK